MELGAEAKTFRGIAAQQPNAAGAGRVFPGLYPPAPRDLDATIRRVLLAMLFALATAGAASYLMFSRSAELFPAATLALAVAIAAAAWPWHRFRRDAFAVISVLTVAWIAWVIFLTGGAASPHIPLTFLGVAISTVPLSRRPAIVLGMLAAVSASAPLLYQQVALREQQELVVRSGVLSIGALFAVWLVAEVRRTVALATEHRVELESQQQLASELQRVQSVRQEYLSVLAHELRNPLNAINAAARVLAKDIAGMPQESTARGIATEAHHAMELLDGLTDVASLESGRMRLALRPTDLAAVVRDTAAPIADGHRIVVRGADHPLYVLGDDRRLGQVIRNLVTNAAKYSPPEAEIQVSLGISADRKNAIVQVRDQGPGIPPSERQRLFQKFARLSTAGGTRGSGLGLYISRGIVNDHGGEMWADWPAGGGSVFSFSVPLTGDSGGRSSS